jgi:osmotically-inducible protein OsmY
MDRTSDSKATAQPTGERDYANLKIDADISSSIKMKFATDKLLSDSDINIDTNQRNVTLRGKLNTQAEENRAIQLGRSVDGVRSVHSNLTVKQARTSL